MGRVTLAGPAATALALTPPTLEDGRVHVEALRADAAGARPVGVAGARARSERHRARARRRATGSFAAGEGATSTSPSTCRWSFATAWRGCRSREGKSAAGVVLADDIVRRRKVGLMSGRPEGEAQDLVDPLHYLRSALEPFAEVIEAPLPEMLNARPRRADPRRRRHPRRGRACRARPLGREGRPPRPLRRPAAGAVGRRPARGGPAAAGAAARRRALARRRDVLGRAAAAEAFPGRRALRRAGAARRTSTYRAR